MLTTLRSDRRTRRQANFNLEPLDDRLVLSAGGGAAAAEAAKVAVAEHRHEVQVAKHEAKLAKREARAEAKAARLAAKHARATMPAMPASVTPIVIGGSGSTGATSSGSSAPAALSAGSAPTTAAPALVTGSGSTSTGTGMSTDTGTGTSTTGGGSTGPLPSNVAAALQSLYQEYEGQGSTSSFAPGQPSDKLLQISGTSVEVNLKVASGTDFASALSQLQSAGMQVSSSSSSYGLIEGMLPIADLPAAAAVAASVTPVSPPVLGPPSAQL